MMATKRRVNLEEIYFGWNDRTRRNFLMWSVVCWVAAGPSFVLALMSVTNSAADIFAMALAVFLFVFAYTVASGSSLYFSLNRTPGMRAALRTGFITRMILSVLWPFCVTIDGIVGSVVLEATRPLWSFFQPLGVFFTTICQGIALNVIMFVYMAAVFFVIRFFMLILEEPSDDSRPAS